MGVSLVVRNDSVEEINLAGRDLDILRQLRESIGCGLVDRVSLTERLDMWIDDLSLYNFPVNPVATMLARGYGLTWQNYHGPVILCGVDDDGNSVNLTDDQARALRARLADILG